MLCLEGHGSTIGSFLARLSPLSYGKKITQGIATKKIYLHHYFN